MAGTFGKPKYCTACFRRDAPFRLGERGWYKTCDYCRDAAADRRVRARARERAEARAKAGVTT